MKFSEKYLSIPPYISTSWSHVKALQMSGNFLIITLSDDSQVHIPNLAIEELEQIFQAHAAHLEMQSQNTPSPTQLQAFKERIPFSPTEIFSDQPFIPAFKIGGISGIERLGSAMQHNIEHANAPNLPQEILKKIASIASIIAPSDTQDIPQPEPHCNCPHCQIARAIHEGLGNTTRPFSGQNASQEINETEEIADEDLTFQQWEIQQTGNRLFVVTNKLDSNESYRVFLGEPVGCTCGKLGCEHILAVLHS